MSSVESDLNFVGWDLDLKSYSASSPVVGIATATSESETEWGESESKLNLKSIRKVEEDRREWG